jgi:hypothetical protein
MLTSLPSAGRRRGTLMVCGPWGVQVRSEVVGGWCEARGLAYAWLAAALPHRVSRGSWKQIIVSACRVR